MAAPLSEAERRHALATRLRDARARTDSLFQLLTPQGLFERPIAERHRLIFYLGHLEAFDWNLICRDALGLRSSNSTFEALFAFGIDPVDGQLPRDTPSDWPELAAIGRWNTETRNAVDEALARAPLTGWLEEGWGFQIALEHRLMHAETLCYLLQRLEPHFKIKGPLPEQATARASSSTTAVVPAGVARLGLSRALAPRQGWDNEYEAHEVQVPSFSMAKHPVSNAEWLEFLEAGGYRERSLWGDDAWAWLASEGVAQPAFWNHRDGRWWWKTMFGEVPLPPAWPVYVSHAEATAYARWKGAHLPSEAQWHRATGEVQPAGLQGNLGGVRFDPVASGSYPATDTTRGISDLIGNGWEWTSTVFAPFEGFEPLPFYPGYSAPFFDGRHFVMKGASASTDLALVRPTFRNWFQPHYQHVFAKFRLVDQGSDRA